MGPRPNKLQNRTILLVHNKVFHPKNLIKLHLDPTPKCDYNILGSTWQALSCINIVGPTQVNTPANNDNLDVKRVSNLDSQSGKFQDFKHLKPLPYCKPPHKLSLQQGLGPRNVGLSKNLYLESRLELSFNSGFSNFEECVFILGP